MNFNEIIQFAVENNFLELYLKNGSKPTLRIHKDLIEIENLPILNQVMIENILLEIISKDQLKQIQEKRSTIFHYKMSDLCSLKVYIEKNQKETYIIIQNINHPQLELEDLNLPPQIDLINQANSGLFIISGNKYDGKTTTLNAICNHINQKDQQLIMILQEEKHIITQSQSSIVIEGNIEQASQINMDVLIIDQLITENLLALINQKLNLGTKVIISLYANNVVNSIRNFLQINSTQAQEILGQHLKLIINQEILRSKIDQNLYPVSEILIINQENQKLINELDYSKIQTLIETGKNQGMQTKKQDTSALQRLGLEI